MRIMPRPVPTAMAQVSKRMGLQGQAATPRATNDTLTLRFSGEEMASRKSFSTAIHKSLKGIDTEAAKSYQAFAKVLHDESQRSDLSFRTYTDRTDGFEYFRKYIVEEPLQKEAAYTNKACLGAALALAVRLFMDAKVSRNEMLKTLQILYHSFETLPEASLHTMAETGVLEETVQAPYPLDTVYWLAQEAVSRVTPQKLPEKQTELLSIEEAFAEHPTMRRLLVADSPAEILALWKKQPKFHKLLSEGGTVLSEESLDLKSLLPQMEISRENPESQPIGTLFLKAYMGDEAAMIHLTRRILFSEDALALMLPVLRRIDTVYRKGWYDRADEKALQTFLPVAAEKMAPAHAHYPNLSELFLLLANPDVQEGHRDFATLLTLFLNIGLFQDKHGVEHLPATLRQQLMKVGVLGHRFDAWRHDSQGGQDSLFAKFGFTPLTNRDSDGLYGPGFLISKAIKPALTLDPKTLVEIRKTYILITHPSSGSLLIRNSNPGRGRDLLAEPAYYSPKFLYKQDIKDFAGAYSLGPHGFKHLLDSRFYQRSSASRADVPNLENGLTFLLGEAEKLQSQYAAWRFKSDAFDAEGNFTGDLTGGMKALTRRLEEQLAENELGDSSIQVPHLGLYHPGYPLLAPYGLEDADGKSQPTLAVTRELLNEIKARLDLTWQAEDYPNSQWLPFVQKAVNTQGEILLVDPPKPRREDANLTPAQD